MENPWNGRNHDGIKMRLWQNSDKKSVERLWGDRFKKKIWPQKFIQSMWNVAVFEMQIWIFHFYLLMHYDVVSDKNWVRTNPRVTDCQSVCLFCLDWNTTYPCNCMFIETKLCEECSLFQYRMGTFFLLLMFRWLEEYHGKYICCNRKKS